MRDATKRPWKLDELPSPVYGSNGSLVATGIRISNVATCYGTTYTPNAANAELIVRAVNSYDAMRVALEAIARMAKSDYSFSEMQDIAKAALAQQEEPSHA